MRNRTIAIGQLVKADESGEVQEAMLIAACSGRHWQREDQIPIVEEMGIDVVPRIAKREHAEAAILRHAEEEGLEVRAIAASRTFCPPCRDQIEQRLEGASIAESTQRVRLRDPVAEAEMRAELREWASRADRSANDPEDEGANRMRRATDRGIE